jgi:hypothetical protein
MFGVVHGFTSWLMQCPGSSWMGQLLPNPGATNLGPRAFHSVKTEPLVVYWNTSARHALGEPCHFLETTLGEELTDEQLISAWPRFAITLEGDGTHSFGTYTVDGEGNITLSDL